MCLGTSQPVAMERSRGSRGVLDRTGRERAPGRWAAVAAGALAVVGVALPAATIATPASPSDATLRRLFESRGRQVGVVVDGLALTDAAGAAVLSGAYGAVAGTEFGSLTPRHELAWDLTEPSRGSFDFSRSDPIVEFARRHGQAVHGGDLVSDASLPRWVAEGGGAPMDLLAAIVGHVSGVVTHFRGEVASWTVVSALADADGTRRDTPFERALGDAYVAEALRAARAADPAAKLYIGDRGIEGLNPKSQAVYELARSLKERGVPLDGVRVESHLAVGGVPASLRRNLQRFADLGLDVAIGPVDVRIPYPADTRRLARQADDYREFARTCLRVTRCVGVTIAGVYDVESEVGYEFPGSGRPLLFDDSFARKPAYRGLASALIQDSGSGGDSS